MEKRIAYFFTSWIPQFVETRLRGMQNSGILNWWNKFATGHLLKLRANSKMRADIQKDDTTFKLTNENRKSHQNKKEHIFAIYYILFFGCFFAFILWMLEILFSITAGITIQRIIVFVLTYRFM